MNAKWKKHVPVTLLAALVLVGLILVELRPRAQAQRIGGFGFRTALHGDRDPGLQLAGHRQRD